ncbi:MAG TPA: hypothetical protein VFK82_01015, partial [Burkholderiaceae bacterium]|nr:hypothetical protein [Burkholderiaceae bacterium]
MKIKGLQQNGGSETGRRFSLFGPGSGNLLAIRGGAAPRCAALERRSVAQFKHSNHAKRPRPGTNSHVVVT